MNNPKTQCVIKFDELIISFQIVIVILKIKEEGGSMALGGDSMPKTPRPNTADWSLCMPGGVKYPTQRVNV